MAGRERSGSGYNINSSASGAHPWIGNAALKKLCSLLRNEGDRVLNGNSAFTLTTEILSQLCWDCRRHSLVEGDISSSDVRGDGPESLIPLSSRMRAQQEANKAKAEWSSYIQFIKDFMLSTPSLKVIHYSGTLSSPISLHRFGNLSSLHLRKVPIHMVEGLHKLRATLSSLTVYRCVDKLKDLLESCGGDMSAPMTWPQLKFVSLMFNSMSSLDDSLRLLPYVEVLDLSHNCLETCDIFLQFLGDVQSLTLAYNMLTHIPYISLTMRSSLTCLVMRGNNLDSVKGVEELVGLVELDLGENCLNDHSFLDPLSTLTRLRQLQLDGNPVFYHRLHRPLTVLCLARQAVTVEFELDKKRLSLSEISYFSSLKRHHVERVSVRSSHIAGREPSNTSDRETDYGLSPSSGIGSENDSAVEVIASPKSSRKHKRKRLKARHTKILDPDFSGDVSSSRDITPGTSPSSRSFEEQMKARREEARKTQKEIEDLRKHYGPNWLQAIDDRDIFQKRKSKEDVPVVSSPETSDCETKKADSAKFVVGSKSDSESSTKQMHGSDGARDNGAGSYTQQDKNGSPTDDDLYLTETKMNDANNPIMAAIARLAAGKSTDEANGEQKADSAVRFSGLGSSPQQIVNINVNDMSQGAETTQKSDRSDEKLSLVPSVIPRQQVDSTSNLESDTASSNRHIPTLSDKADENVSISYQTTLPQSSLSLALNQTPEKRDDMCSLASLTNISCRKSSDKISPLKSDSEADASFTMSKDEITEDMEISTDSSPFFLEEEKVAESMFASLPLQDNQMTILTLTKTFLVEKDIRGKVTEKLDLNSLSSMEVETIRKTGEIVSSGKPAQDQGTQMMNLPRAERAAEDDQKDGRKEEMEGPESMKMDLKFDYVRKDRQRRCYLLDFTDGEILRNHLQPLLDAKQEETRTKFMVVMQCLKCNRTFLEGEVVRQRKELPTSGSSRDLQSIQDIMGKPTLMCPKCGSTIVIELDNTQTTTKSVTSEMSTPVGSHSSTGSFLDQAKKPAPLLKHRSFDHTSPQATLAARMRSRKNSSDSFSSISGVPGSLGRDNQSRSQSVVSAGRERSNAFSASQRMSRSAMDDLVCVEDHFAEEAITTNLNSRLLAEMTTSLQGDASSRSRKMEVERQSQEQPKKVTERAVYGECNHRQAGILETGLDSNGLQAAPISVMGGGKRGGNRSRQGAETEEDEKFLRSSSKIITAHSSLAAMEDLVNTLVSEGQSLEEQEQFGAGFCSSVKGGRSVSISAFRKSSSSQGHIRASISSTEESEMSAMAELKHCDSSSSITVLPIPSADLSLQPVQTATTSSSSEPVSFSVGTPIDTVSLSEPQTMTDSSAVSVTSPLSSNICSSMVSSVYETSVNTPPDTNTNSITMISDGQTLLPMVSDSADSGNIPVVIVGSSSSSSEDLTSIYDRPREPRYSSKKINASSGYKSKLTAVSLPAESDAIWQENTVEKTNALHDISCEVKSGHESDTQRVLNDQAVEEAPPSLLTDTTTMAHGAHFHGHSNDDSADSDNGDEKGEQDVVPQYAFYHLNHRLTLHMMMSLFDTDEQFVCKIQAEIVQYIIEESYEGILVMTSERFYILKITSQDHSQPPNEWLHCVEIQPIPELRYIDMGLGGQSLRLEFVTDCSSYTLITRNRDKTIHFVELLHTHLAKYAVTRGITSNVVVNEDADQVTLNNLDQDVVSKVRPNQKLLLYCMGSIERGNQKWFPLSFVITTCDICLVKANHQWPQPRLQAPITVESVGKQFTVLERQKINNVASVEVCEATMKKIRLQLFNEMEGICVSWNITMAARQTTVDFINALSEPWAREFGVEMEITYAELNF